VSKPSTQPRVWGIVPETDDPDLAQTRTHWKWVSSQPYTGLGQTLDKIHHVGVASVAAPDSTVRFPLASLSTACSSATG
jgi:hypothetical protein